MDNRNTMFVCIFLVLCLLPTILSENIDELDETFFSKTELIRLFSFIRYSVGDRLFQDTIISEGNWLVYADDRNIQDYQNSWPLSDQQLRITKNKLEKLESYLTERGIEFYILIAPTKNSIYPEFVPSEIPVIGELSRLDQFLPYMEENTDIKILDIRDTLIREKDKRELYYTTDTHWNPYGAYFAYKAFMDEINHVYPDLTPRSLEELSFEAQLELKGDQALRLVNIDIKEEFFKFIPNDEISKKVFEFLTINFLERKPHMDAPSLPVFHAVFGDDLRPYLQEHNSRFSSNFFYRIPNSDAPSLLVFHDSFGVGLRPYLSEHFSRSSFFSFTGEPFDLSIIDVENPDIFLLVWIEQNFYFRLNYAIPYDFD